jgi:F-type H+-transporting ATPase subunit b
MKRIITTAALAARVAALSLPAWAEEAKEGLPQFDTSLFPAQLFWLAVSFVLLYVLMAFVALPGVRRTQDKRHEIIASELAAASAANDAAKAMIAQYEKALADARAKAQAMVSDMAAKAAKDAAARQAEQQEALTKRLHEAEAKIAAARDAALNDARAQADSLALLITEKVAGAR